MSVSDSNIIERLRKGDEKAFEYVFNLYRARLCFFADKLVGDPDEVEDIVSDTYMKLWERRDRFDNLTSIKAFLYIAVRNQCFDFLKYNKRVRDSKKDYAYWASHQDEMDLLMFQSELAHKLSEEIERLPEKCRVIVKLAYYEGLSSEEIAQKLNLSIKTVWNQKVTAVNKLRTDFLKRKLLPLAVACILVSELRILLFLAA